MANKSQTTQDGVSISGWLPKPATRGVASNGLFAARIVVAVHAGWSRVSVLWVGISCNMKIRASLVVSLLAIPLAGCVSSLPSGKVMLSQLPDIQSGDEFQPYRVDPYLNVVVALQSVDHETALERLHDMAQGEDGDVPSHRVTVLCRMLFTKRPGSDFRLPALGEPLCMGGTGYIDWPLLPIELVDGVPFIITGYRGGGRPESDEAYLEYCETNCDWSPFHYSVKTKREERDALSKLIASPKWKTPLKAFERQFLAGQIQ